VVLRPRKMFSKDTSVDLHSYTYLVTLKFVEREWLTFIKVEVLYINT
jgi:hypothetical protein